MASRFRVPHTLILLLLMMTAALVATWVIPQGSFEMEVTEAGQSVVVPGTFQVTEERTWLGPWHLLTAIPRAFVTPVTRDIIFFLFIIGGVLAVIRATGAIDALFGKILESFGRHPGALIFAVIFVFALASSAMGASAEYIPFVLILVALCRALKMDSMTAVGMVIAGYGVGYGVAAFNQYTVVVAQGIAELPTYSGWPVRLSLTLPFVLIAYHHVWSYSRQVRANPEASLVRDIEPPELGAPPRDYPALTAGHVTILLSFIAALGVAVWGIARWGWYLHELGACFLVVGMLAAAIGRIGPSDAAVRFVGGARDLVETALLVGVARGIALIMEDGQILHTLVHYLSFPLSYLGPLAAVGMLFIQSVLNFFVPSGSGQALVTMPLMAPLGDLVGVTRQVSVLAYQFGDGFANIIVPTNAVLMGILGMAGVPYDRWFRFCMPLLLKLLALAAVVLVVVVLLGWA
jgi:uncharacterized ion transporter superfamily protein YfcC